MTVHPSQHESVKAALLADLQKAEAAKRKLELIEEYEAMMREESKKNPAPAPAKAPSPSPAVNGHSNFSALKKPDAVVVILKENHGPMKAKTIFDEMKKRGHPVKTSNALRATLNLKSDLFSVTESGEWWLAGHPIPQTSKEPDLL